MVGSRGRLVAALAGAVLLAGCVQAPPLDVRLTWLDVTPDGVVPTALAASESGLVVGGTNLADTGPSLVMATGEPVPLVPTEPYATSARIVAATSYGGQLYLIGGRAGGAHENTRVTVWDGPVTGPVTSHEQGFFTFGGHDAGPLLGTVIVDGHPIIVGSRGGNAGTDLALYAVDNVVWHQLDTPAAMRSANRVVLGFSAATAVGSTIVIVGDMVKATESGAVQTPALYYGAIGGDWHRVELPVEASHSVRHATGVVCDGTTCWVAGWAEHPVVWKVSLADGSVSESTVLSGDRTGTDEPSALVSIVDGRPLVVTNASSRLAAIRCTGGWTSVTAPAQTTAVLGTGADAYVVAGDRLWRATVPSC
jgi:hypothetical protein